MKTFIIELENVSSEKQRDLIGFILTVGLNFRKINQVKGDKTSKVLFLEVESRSEEIALKSFLKQSEISSAITIEKSGKVISNGKLSGKFLPVISEVSEYFLDDSTGKKFNIVR